MDLNEIKKIFHSELINLFDKDEIEQFFKILMEEYLNMKPIELVLNPSSKIESSHEELFFKALSELKLQKPIQYIVSKTHFYGLEFKLNENVLIPRPETEELVDWIMSEFRIQNSEFRILDIGTGSGCIAVALAKNLPNAKVFALDVSKEALKIAKYNTECNHVAVELIESNILELDELPYTFDIIVSNPPYVREIEKEMMKANVLLYEPHLALFVNDNDSLLFYDKISKLAYKSLKDGGALYFEINQYLGKEMRQLLNNDGFCQIELKKDIYGNDRMLKCIKE